MIGLVLPGLAPSSYEEVKDFIETNPYAKKRFQEASDIIGYSLAEAFREAKEEQHEVFESAFLANSIALLDYFYDRYGLQPHYSIGASFGGMSVAVQSAGLTFAESMWLTHESAKHARGYFQRMDGEYHTHFIFNLSLEETEELIKSFNSKGMELELVGHLEKVVCLCAEKSVVQSLKEVINQRSKCFSLHTMKQPIHSRLLTDLKHQLRDKYYSQVVFKPLQSPIISDVDGHIYKDPEELKQMLLDGYDHPVRWDLVSKSMKQKQIKTAYVVGPRNLFTQLLKYEFKTVGISPDTVMHQVGIS
jgi:[acyl-carrier-protein] S-malonyltransferase